jgi:transcriptional regulator with GAF, ATPase, and Fis domain
MPMDAPEDPTLRYRSAMKLDGVIGRSAALADLFRRVRSIASLGRLPVLLTGETGTGKSLIARSLHDNGPRADGPFVEVNCAAIPRDLWEAEFFGCVRGAYTQAGERAGRFAAAQGGTLFLDEIGELPMDQQAKLLRVLAEGRYERLGEDRTRQADVRVIAATNRCLQTRIAQGQLRPDLYYRLNGYAIRVPSLAERSEDVPLLATVLVDRECKALEIDPLGIDDCALRALARRPWPGNVRELQSVIARAVIEAHADGALRVASRHCAASEAAGHGDVHGSLQLDAELESGAIPYAQATREFQGRLLRSALASENGNATRAARRLGLSRSHFHTLARLHRLPGAQGSALQ